MDLEGFAFLTARTADGAAQECRLLVSSGGSRDRCRSRGRDRLRRLEGRCAILALRAIGPL
jgi:hypothetical protein